MISNLVINRFSGNGILITNAGGVNVFNTYVGTDASGSVDLGNGLDGVSILNSADNRINMSVLSGNGGNGLFIGGGSSAVGNLITDNRIGTNAAGTAPLGNMGAGVLVQGPSNNVTANTISANSDGVVLDSGLASGNVVSANFIGTNSAGANLGNINRGIAVTNSASSNQIDSNAIAFNGTGGSATSRAGLSVESGAGNTIAANSIHDNLGLGIDLLPAGVTPNDDCDPDSGPNNLQNFPNLATATSDGTTSTFVGGNINSTPNTTFTIDFFANSTCDPSLNADNRLKTQWELAASPAVKISVRKQGWYRVGQADLVAAGLNPGADPRLLQLYADGQELPMLVNGTNKSRLEPGDSIEFYGMGMDTASTDSRIYWLVAGTQPGKRIKAAQDGGANPGAERSFAMTVERKDRSIYFSALKNGEAENFFGPVITKEAVSQTLSVRNLDADAAGETTLEVALQGVTDLRGVETDHKVSVLLNGVDVGSLVFSGREHKSARLAISHKSLREGDNLVTLVAEGEMDISLLDYIRLTYRHTYKADDNALYFTAQGGEAIKVGGFGNSNIRVLDVTDPYAPQAVAVEANSQSGGFEAMIGVPGSGPRVLIAVSDQGVSKASSVLANQPSKWNRKDQKADLLIISHKDFLATLGPLVELRRGEGLSVSAVDAEDVYDEFSYGAHSPFALRDFLSNAQMSWKKPPQFVMLVGDASIDPRGYMGQGDFDFVPTKLIDTSYM